MHGMRNVARSKLHLVRLRCARRAWHGECRFSARTMNNRTKGKTTMKTNSKTQAGVKVAAGVKAGGLQANHCRRLLGLAVKSGIKAGQDILHANHNRRLA